MKFLESTRKPKVIYTDNSLEFGKSCEELSWNHCTSTPHRSETNEIAERAVRRVKEETSAVLLQSRLDSEWSVDSIECYCYLRNIQDKLSDGKTLYERRFGMPFDGPAKTFWSNGWMSHHLCERPVASASVRHKSLASFFLGYALYAGRIWKGDIMVADIEELEQMDASELHARGLNEKEVLTPQRSGNFIFPIADGTVKTPGGDRRLRPSILIRDRPERGEEQEVFRGESDGLSSPTPHQDDSTRDDAEAQKRFLVYYGRLHLPSSRWTQSQTVHARRKNISKSDEAHRRYHNNTHVTWCIVGKTDWWSLERGWRSWIVKCVDRLHKIHFVERKVTWRIYMVEGETDEETNDLKTRRCMARFVDAYVWCSKEKAKQRSAIEKPKLDNARQLRGIFFVKPNDVNRTPSHVTFSRVCAHSW